MQKLPKIWMLTLMMVVSATASAAPVGYSINSDSGSGDADGLYRIDLATGIETRIGTVQSNFVTRIDVEGLAFAPDGTLYAVDDDTLALFPLDLATAAVDTQNEVGIGGLPIGGQNDFGMTFACDGNLYVTSIAKGSLYRLGLDGSTTVIGSEGSLNPVKISALAAYGNPVELYGLGSGANSQGAPETPNLYRIDLETGTVGEPRPLGNQAGPYLQGGLSFDANGELWAITEGAQFDWPSQVMKIDVATGTASDVKNTSEQGFESLAITVPVGCDTTPHTGGNSSAENIPTLSPAGLLLTSLLLLLTGLVATRRF